MTTAIHLCGPDDADILLGMVAQFHNEIGIETTADERANSVVPILEGTPLAVAYLFGPKNAPVGYLIISFGWSLELGGMDGFLDEIWIRPNVRKRGLAQEALNSVIGALSGAGLKAIHLEVNRNDGSTQSLYRRMGFRMREKYALMTRVL